MSVNTKIQVRRGSSTEWANTNPVLASGEPGHDTTNNIIKIGDGITSWLSLSNHKHDTTNITDFNSAVSGLLPVKSLSAGSGISITSTSGSFTITNTGSSGSSSSNNNILEYTAPSGFPASGTSQTLYISKDTNRIYRWDTSSYVEVGSVGGGDTSLWNLFLPPQPTSVSGTPGNSQVSLTWTAPTVLSQTPVTDYIIQYSSNSGTTWTTFSDGTSISTSATVTGLTNNIEYVFRVAAVNALGTGIYSSSSQSVTPISGDAYFGNVKLLLHFDGNLTDSSQSARTVTAYNSATVSSTQKKFGSNSLKITSASNQYVSVPDDSAWTFASNAATIECWVYFDGYGNALNNGLGYNTLMGQRTSATSAWFIHIGSGAYGINGPHIELTNSSGVTIKAVSSSNSAYATPLNEWVHIAITWDGSTLRCFQNGVLTASDSYSGSWPDHSGALEIGRLSQTGEKMSGYIDDIRISNVCRYTANFTPPSAAFPNDFDFSSVSLLLHFDGNLTDSSQSGRTVTAQAGASTSTTQKKFGTHSVYIDDASSQYLTLPDSSAWAFTNKTMTIEFWTYLDAWANAGGNYNSIIGQRQNNANAWYLHLCGGISNLYGPYLELLGSDGATPLVTVSSSNSSYSTPLNQWVHIAITWDGTNIRTFQDGILVSTVAYSGNWVNSSDLLLIGRLTASNETMSGYIDDLRISQVCRYISTFTPPTSAYLNY